MSDPNTFIDELNQRLDKLRQDGLSRQLRVVESPQGATIQIGQESLLNFSSNDYLGLANEPRLKAAAEMALGEFGAGSGASRLICGSLKVHHQLEEKLAEFKRTEAAIVFSSGYATALGTIAALMGPGDVIVLDKLVHASIVDAAKLSGARIRVFPHNDLNKLESILKWATQQNRGGETSQILVVTESIFSMEGDRGLLLEIVRLKEQYGAWLMVDEAHATGLYGQRRSGLIEALDLGSHVEVQMGTLGKALGAAGGYICGSRTLIDYLVNRARSFVFSTAPVPAATAAAQAAIDIIASSEGATRCAQLWRNARTARGCIGEPSDVPPADESAIIPVHIGDEERAVQLSTHLRRGGIFIPAIRYPTVARGKARLRLTVTAAHTTAHLATLAKVWANAVMSP